MKFVLLFIVFSVGCFAAPELFFINDRIRGMLEDLRVQMEEGFPDSGIPPLAPLLIDHLDVDLQTESIQTVGFFKNVRVDGLNQFVDDVIIFSLVGLRLTFRILVPEIRFSGFYELDGRILNRFPLRGTGDFHGKALDIVMDGHCRIGIRDGFLYMREFETRLALGSVVSEFDGLVSDQTTTSDFMNRLIEALIPELFVLHEEAISQRVADVAIPMADSRLNNMTIGDLIG